jgi:hypothetical protein
MGRDGPRVSGGKKTLNRQICNFGYLPFVERMHLQATQCSTVHETSTMLRNLHRRLSLSGIATRLTNVSVKPSGSSQRDGSHVWTWEGKMLT